MLFHVHYVIYPVSYSYNNWNNNYYEAYLFSVLYPSKLNRSGRQFRFILVLAQYFINKSNCKWNYCCWLFINLKLLIPQNRRNVDEENSVRRNLKISKTYLIYYLKHYFYSKLIYLFKKYVQTRTHLKRKYLKFKIFQKIIKIKRNYLNKKRKLLSLI